MSERPTPYRCRNVYYVQFREPSWIWLRRTEPPYLTKRPALEKVLPIIKKKDEIKAMGDDSLQSGIVAR